MFVASLLDLGADKDVLQSVLDTIPIQGFKIKITEVKKAGLLMCDFDVVLDKEYENHDHDMEYLMGSNESDKKEQQEQTHSHSYMHEHGIEHEHNHGIEHEHNHGNEHEHNHGNEHEHNHGNDHEHNHENDHNHNHGNDHEHNHDHHDHAGHEHRGMAEVLDILEHTRMTRNARNIAVRVFTILGEAEAKAHGTTLEQVHFHEVGAIDSIVDIVAAAVCLDNLNVSEVCLPVLYEGQGKIRCQHGLLPVPVPAVANIVAANDLTLHIIDMQSELVTPTGAAIAAAIRTKDTLPAAFKIKKIGIGAGKRKYENPSFLRAMLIETETKSTYPTDLIYKLESNIDDCTGENFGYVMELLLQAGARDVNYTPVFMKKNRPAYQLNVICTKEDIEKLEDIIFRETTTIGIRRIPCTRSILKREVREVETSLGMVKVKVCEQENETKIYPEYESVVSLCRLTKKSFREVFQLIERECYGKIK